MEIVIDTMNVLLTVPVDTVGIVCEAAYVDDEGERKCAASFLPADVHRAFQDFYVMQEDYYPEHMDMIADDAKEYPVIFQIPETAYAADLTFLCLGMVDGVRKQYRVERHLKRSDMKRLRNDFLRYIPDGDHYNDVYVLADGALDELGKMQALTEAEFDELLKEGNGT